MKKKETVDIILFSQTLNASTFQISVAWKKFGFRKTLEFVLLSLSLSSYLDVNEIEELSVVIHRVTKLTSL